MAKNPYDGYEDFSYEDMMPGTGAPPGAPRGSAVDQPFDYNKALQDAAKAAGVSYDPSDYEGIVRNTTYSGNSTNKAISPDQAFQNQLNIYQQRANNQPNSGQENPTQRVNVPGQQAPADDWIAGVLKDLGTGGKFNQDVTNRRVSNARDALNSNRKSQMATNEAALASRGLIGDGPQKTAMSSLDDRLNENFNSAVNDIYADESQNADQRMMQALGLASGNEQAALDRAVSQFRADTERLLGQGNLDLGKGRLALDNSIFGNNYNLDLAKFGLQRDLALEGLDNATIDQLIKILGLNNENAQTSARGYTGD